MRRPAEEYLTRFSEIREIHDYIVESAIRAGVYLIENISIETTSDAAVEVVVNRVSGIAEKAQRRESSLLMHMRTQI